MHSGENMLQYLGAGYTPVGKVDLTTAPDIFQGYGRVDLSNILPLSNYSIAPFTLFIDQATLTPLTEFVYKVNIETLNHHLKVTLAWFDPPNPEFAARVLVHDLDLLVSAS